MSRAEITRKFDEIVDFAEIEQLPRHAGQALLERHVRAARLRRRRPPRAGDPDRRRGAGRRRRRLPAQVPRQDERGRQRGPDRPLRQPQPGDHPGALHAGVLLERGGMVADAPIDEAIDTYLRSLERSASADLARSHGSRSPRSMTRRWCGGWRSGARAASRTSIVAGQGATIVVEVTERCRRWSAS